MIDREPFVAHAPSGQEPRLIDSIPQVTIPQAVLSVIETLTQSTWRRAEKDVPNRRPTSIRFLNDWTYVTSYRDGACENRGTWYATKKEIRGYTPTNPCDEAEGGYGENLRGAVLEKGDLLLNGNTYVRR